MYSLPPVPDCEGPKLRPFQSHGTPEITFLTEIGKGAHAHVFKVQIDGRIFALKVFNFQIIDTDWLTMDQEEASKIDEKMVRLLGAQWHPFHAECRAYGRLKEARKEHLAIPCHGYIRLTEEQKKELEGRFGIKVWWSDDYDLDTDDPEVQEEFRQEERHGLHAIVKDFVEGDAPFGPEHAATMVSNVRQLHRLGIMVHDLKEDAYVAGKLVDFSKALVVPHVRFDPRFRGNPDNRARSEVHEDLAILLGMFMEWNEEHEGSPPITCDPFKDMEAAVGRLRRGPLTRDEYLKRTFNPLKIRWQKFSRHTTNTAPTTSPVARKSGRAGTKPIGVSKRKAPSRKQKTRN